MYVAVKGGQRAIENAHKLLEEVRRGDSTIPELSLDQVTEQLGLAVARVLSHRLFVMKEGKIVESGLTDQILDDPRHPYTQLLVACRLQP